MTTKVKANQLRESYLEGITPTITAIQATDGIVVTDLGSGAYQVSLQTTINPPDYFTPVLTGAKLDLAIAPEDAVCFANNGLKLYLTMNDNTNSVASYDLTTAYDLSTATFNKYSDLTTSFNKWTWVDNNGVRCLWHEVIGSVQSWLHYGYFSTPYDASTYVEEGAEALTPNSEGHAFSMVDDGNRIIGSFDTVVGYTYDLMQSVEFSPAYVPTSTLQSNSYNFNVLRGIRTFASCLTSDGLIMWSCEGDYKNKFTPVTLVKRELSTAFDITTISEPQIVYDISGLDGFSSSFVRAMAVNPTGTKLFILHRHIDNSSGRLSEVTIGE